MLRAVRIDIEDHFGYGYSSIHSRTTPIDGTTRAVVVDGHTVVSYVHDTVFFAAAGSVRSSEVGRADALLAR